MRCTCAQLFSTSLLVGIVCNLAYIVHLGCHLPDPTMPDPRISPTQIQIGQRPFPQLRDSGHTNAEVSLNPPHHDPNLHVPTTSTSSSTSSSTSTPIPLKDAWLAGIVLDATKIHDKIWKEILQLNCGYNVGIHIISKENAEVAKRGFMNMNMNMMDMDMSLENGYSGYRDHDNRCAPVDIISQDEALRIFAKINRNMDMDENSITRKFYHDPMMYTRTVHPNDLAFANNRIDRISALRDVQRMLLLEEYSHLHLHSHSSRGRDNIADLSHRGANDNGNEVKDGIVIVADLDLFKLPKIELLVEQMIQLQNSSDNRQRHTETTTITSEHSNKEQRRQQQERYTYPHDAICAAGVTMNLSQNNNRRQAQSQAQAQDHKRKHNRGNENGVKTELWYYDTFATVFYPDTFSHPLKRRLISKFYSGEDPKLVRSDDQQHGKFTQRDIYQYMKREGKKSPTGNMRVTSCFGGLAMYRASVYFESKCGYQLKLRRRWDNKVDVDVDVDVDVLLEEVKGGGGDKQHNAPTKHAHEGTDTNTRTTTTSMTIMRYANVQEERPCEHVVFHDCLKNRIGGFDISINPNLVSLWKRDS